MFPISLDLSRIRITLVGTGDAFARRHAQLLEMSATQITLYENTLPGTDELGRANIVMVVGLDNEVSSILSSNARRQGILVNVEDKPELCDFYFTSFIRRGDLTLAVSTNGKSPTLAQEIKKYLENIFHPGWGKILEDIGKHRLNWRTEGLDNKTIGQKTRDMIHAFRLLPDSKGTTL